MAACRPCVVRAVSVLTPTAALSQVFQQSRLRVLELVESLRQVAVLSLQLLNPVERFPSLSLQLASLLLELFLVFVLVVLPRPQARQLRLESGDMRGLQRRLGLRPRRAPLGLRHRLAHRLQFILVLLVVMVGDSVLPGGTLLVQL